MSNKGYSRGQLEQMKARVARELKNGHDMWHEDRCIVCGKNFRSQVCPHSFAENTEAFRVLSEQIRFTA